MAGQFFDVRDVGAVVKQVGAIGMAENVWRQRLPYSGIQPERLEELGNVAAIQSARNACRDEYGRIVIRPIVEELLDPGDGGGAEEDFPGLAALAHDVQVGLA